MGMSRTRSPGSICLNVSWLQSLKVWSLRYLLRLFTVNVTGGYQSRGLVPTLKNFVRLACHRLDKPFNSWGPELYAVHPVEGRQAVNWARVV